MSSTPQATAQTHFERVRQYIRKSPSAFNWTILLEVVGTILDDSDQDMVTCFRAQYLPAIESLIKRAYPAVTRCTELYKPISSRALCATLVLDFGPYQMQHYATHLGLRHKRGVTKRMIDDLTPHWLEGTKNLTGLVIKHLSQHHLYLIKALLKSPTFSKLEFLKLEGVHDAKDAINHAHMLTMLHHIIEEHGDALHTIIIKPDAYSTYTLSAALLHEALIERASSLPSLRWLGFGWAREGTPDPFILALKEPAFDQLETLSLHGLDPQRLEALTSREASRNLRRINIGGFRYEESWYKEIRPILLSHENLDGVINWDIRKIVIKDEFLDHERALLVRAEQGKESVQTLNHDVVDLRAHHPEQAIDVLFEDGVLRASTTLKALRVVDLGVEDVQRIVQSCAAAWPNLECLIFTGYYYEQDHLVDVLCNTTFPPSLRFLDWDGSGHHGRHLLHTYNTPRLGDYERRLLGLITQQNHPAFMRYRVWKELVSRLKNMPSLKATLTALGSKGHTSMSKDKLNAHADAFIRDYLKDDGPIYADASWEVTLIKGHRDYELTWP